MVSAILGPPIPELAARARRLCGGRRRAILGITGAPGAGKTTLAGEMVAALAPHAVAVPMDGYHLANAELARLGRRARKGAPDTFDAAGYVALLRRLRDPDEELVYAPAFHREIEEPVAGEIPVPATVPLVVTEGNYLLLREGPWAEVRGLVDEVWYVEPDDSVRLDRLVRRHVAFGKSESSARDWALGSDELNASVVRACRDRADLIVVPGQGRSSAGGAGQDAAQVGDGEGITGHRDPDLRT